MHVKDKTVVVKVERRFTHPVATGLSTATLFPRR